MPVNDEPSSLPIHSAVVTILRPREDDPEDEIESPVSFRATVLSIEEPLMRLRCPVEAPARSALKIETERALWLGETEKCDPDQDSWLVRVRLRHVLRDFETLARLAERFGTAAPKRASVQA